MEDRLALDVVLKCQDNTYRFLYCNVITASHQENKGFPYFSIEFIGRLIWRINIHAHLYTTSESMGNGYTLLPSILPATAAKHINFWDDE